MSYKRRVIERADELRLTLAEWASTATEQELLKMGEFLQPLTTDLEELLAGNYDPDRMLGEKEAS